MFARLANFSKFGWLDDLNNFDKKVFGEFIEQRNEILQKENFKLTLKIMANYLSQD